MDAAAVYFLTQPERFDVILTDNMFGDILTSIGAAVAGGIGLAASASINPERTAPSMFEPVHGSAPDIAGKQKADPTAAILSAAMLCEHLGLSARRPRGSSRPCRTTCWSARAPGRRGPRRRSATTSPSGWRASVACRCGPVATAAERLDRRRMPDERRATCGHSVRDPSVGHAGIRDRGGPSCWPAGIRPGIHRSHGDDRPGRPSAAGTTRSCGRTARSAWIRPARSSTTRRRSSRG